MVIDLGQEKLDLRIQVVCPGNSRRINYSMDLFETAIQHTREECPTAEEVLVSTCGVTNSR